jgi:sarcosine oxidase gamma subunit
MTIEELIEVLLFLPSWILSGRLNILLENKAVLRRLTFTCAIDLHQVVSKIYSAVLTEHFNLTILRPHERTFEILAWGNLKQE